MTLPFRSVLTALALSTSAYLLIASGDVGAQEEGRVKLGATSSAPTTGTPHVIGTPFEDSGSAKIGSGSGSARVGSGAARVGSTPGPLPATEGSAMVGGYSGRAVIGSSPSTMGSATVGGSNSSATASVNVPQSWYVPPSAVETNEFPAIGYRVLDDPFEYKLRLDKRVGGLQGYENGYTNLGAFLPFGNGDNSLWFADIRAMVTDNGKAGANIGFGHRYYMEELDAVQGFSFWYDYDDGHEGDAYNQLGLSYSLYSRYWRINANGYFVANDERQTVSSGIFGSPFYINNNIGIGRLNTNEDAYSGADIEIGGPLPILGRYGVDAYIGTYFVTSDEGQDAIGVQGRFEAQINEDLTITGTATQDRVFENNYQLGILYTFPNGSFKPSRWFRQRKVYEAMALADRRNYRARVNQTQTTSTDLLINPADGDPFRVAHIIPPEGVGQGVTPGGTGRIEDPFVSLASYTPDSTFDIILVSQPNGADPGVNLTSGITIFQNQRLLSNSGLANSITSTIGTFTLPDTGFGFGITPILTNAFEDANNNGVLDPTEDIDADSVLDLAGPVVTIDASATVDQDSLTEVRGFEIDGANAGTDFGLELNDGIININGPITGFWIHDNTIRNVLHGIDLTSTSPVYHEDVDFDGFLDPADEDIDGDGRLDLVDEDVNGNMMLDVGEDLDLDGNLDVAEDTDGDGNLDIAEDAIVNGGDGDGMLDIGTEGIIEDNIIIGANFESNRGIRVQHSGGSLLLKVDNNQVGGFRGEDADGDGVLSVNEDLDGDGILDFGEDLDGDGVLDIDEDNNGNGVLDQGIGIEIVNTADGSRSNIFANNLTGSNPDYNAYGISNNSTWLSEDLDGDGVLDPDEDLNGNGQIDILSNGAGMLLRTTNLTADAADFYVELFGNDLSNSQSEVGFGFSGVAEGNLANLEFNLFMNNQFNNNLGDGALILAGTTADPTGIVRFNSLIMGNEFIGNGQFQQDTNGDGDFTDPEDINLANTQDIDGDGADGGDGMRMVVAGAGAQLFIAGIGDTTSTISNNFEGNLDDGLQIDVLDSSVVSEFGLNNIIPVFNNSFNGNGDDGMFVNLDNSVGRFSFGLESDTTLGNSFSNNGAETDLGNGLSLFGQNGSLIAGGVYSNTFTANAANGLFIGLETGSALDTDYEIIGNTMTLNGLDGLQLNMNASTADGTLIALNDASGNGRNGMNFLMEDSAFTDYVIIGNEINNNGNTSLPGPGSFTIDLTFTGAFTPAQQAAFNNAAARWEQIILGDLPDVDLGGGVIVDDVLISAEVVDIDGVGGILGQAGPTGLRAGSFLPFQGIMQFDSADLAQLEADGQLEDVILHEMAHVMGFGTIWDNLALLQNPSNGDGVTNTLFVGPAATAEFNARFGTADAGASVENTGGPGTADSHWRESLFNNELMTGFLNAGVNPISRITIGQWEDLGYVVDYNAADPYILAGGSSSTTVNLNNFEDYSGPVTTNAALSSFFASPLLVPDPGSVGNGIHFQQVNGTSDGSILQNNITGNAEYGVSINLEGTAVFALDETRQNTISQNDLGGVNVVANDDSVFVENVFTGNDVSENGGIGYHVDAFDNADVTINIGGTTLNTFDQNTDAGIGLEFTDDSTGLININNVAVTGTFNGTDPDFFGDGIAIRTSGNSVLSAVQIGNPLLANTLIDGNAGNGIYVQTNGDSEITDLDIENVIITNNTLDGINIRRNGISSLADVLIDQNTILNNTGDGIDIAIFSSSPPATNFDITNNDISENGQNGLTFLGSGSTTSNLLVESNLFDDNGLDGINILAQNFGIINTDIVTNEITSSGVHGIDLQAERGNINFGFTNLNANVAANIVDESGSNGLNVFANVGDESILVDDILLLVNGNEFTNSGNDGVAVRVTARSEVFVPTFVNNLISDSGRHGVSIITDGLLDATYAGNNQSTITFISNNGLNELNNTIINSGVDGVYMATFNPITDLGDELGDTDGDGISNELGVLFSDGTINAIFINDNISNNDRNGVTVYNTATSDINAVIGADGADFTQVRNNGGNGIRVENNNEANNVALNGGETGIGGGYGWAPTITIDVINTEITGNGTNTALADDDRIGLFTRVGTGFGFVDADYLNNTITGSGTFDVAFESFLAMEPPGATTTGNFNPDPLAILDLRLEGNTGGTLDATRDGAFYNNRDLYKSAPWGMAFGEDAAVIGSDGFERRRNAQRYSQDFTLANGNILTAFSNGIVDGAPAPAQVAGPPARTTFTDDFFANVNINWNNIPFTNPVVQFTSGANNGQRRDLEIYNNGLFNTVQFPVAPAGGDTFFVEFYDIPGVGESTFTVSAASQATINAQFSNVATSFTDAIDLGPAAGDGSADPGLTLPWVDPTFTWEIVP